MNTQTTVNTQLCEQLADAAGIIAANGAREYLRVHNLTASKEALSACLVSWIKAQMPVALADAKQAFDCHMDEIAVTTFKASMIQAGIEAAKEASFPIPSVSRNLNKALV